jgi:hypothetical protein
MSLDSAILGHEMEAEFAILSFARPTGGEIPFGILLLDTAQQQLRVQMRRNFSFADVDDAEVLSAISSDIILMAKELGAQKLLNYLEDTVSNAIRITNRQLITCPDIDAALDALYAEHIAEGSMQQWRKTKSTRDD